ncbi:MAG: VUT family protein, partial [Alphaproteobacteria bacterium]
MQILPAEGGARRRFLLAVAAMVVLIAASNVLVQHPINAWLTWGALTYPATFLVTDLINRGDGPRAARRVVYAGFAAAAVVSILLAGPRIALASATAFLAAQLLDVGIFDRLRAGSWWRAPLVSSTVASAFDTLLFFSLAFYGTDVPWTTLLVGDFLVKFVLALAMLGPFRALMPALRLR